MSAFVLPENVVFLALSSAKIRTALIQSPVGSTLSFQPRDLTDGDRALRIDDADQDTEFIVQRISPEQIPRKFGLVPKSEIPLFMWRSSEPGNVQFALLGAKSGDV